MPRREAERIRQFLEETDPRTITSSQATEAVRLFSEIERLGAAGKVLFSARASQSRIWAEEGHRTPASWLAETSRSSMGEAIASLETAEQLESLSETSAALRRGELSFPQLREIAGASKKDPSKEKELLEAASRQSLRALKERAKKIRLVSSSKEKECERYRAISASRYCRAWNDEEGAFRLEARLAPDQGARLLSSLEKETNLVFSRARQKGLREPTHAYRADALVGLVTRASTKDRGCGGQRTDTVVVRVDSRALRRGFSAPGETCEIPGVGPVPVATAREILGEGLLKVVVKDAVDVLSVCHVGRTVPAHIQSALEERDPTCVLCDNAFGLEMHHWRSDYAKSKTTSLSELARLCKHHHDLITYDGYKLIGGPGAWELVPPPAPKILDSG